MKTVILTLLTVLGLLFTTGCEALNPGVKVPKTDLRVDTKAWNLRLKSSKDTNLDKLNIALATNGSVNVTLDKFVATNSPTVITETGKAQTMTIDAQGRVVDATGKVVGEVVNGALKLYGL